MAESVRFEVPVTAEEVRAFARAVGEDNPVLYDDLAARHSGLPGIVAPPTFTMTQVKAMPPGERERALGIEVDYGRILHGEQEFVYRRLPVAGETLSAEMRVVKDETKQGRRGGTMRVITFETVFTDAGGDEVLTAYATMIETGKDPGA